MSKPKVMKPIGKKMSSTRIPLKAAIDIPKDENAAQLEEDRLQKHAQALGLIFGMRKDREGGPPDGVEYQEKMRAAW